MPISAGVVSCVRAHRLHRDGGGFRASGLCRNSSPIHSGLLQCPVGKTIGDARRTRVRRRGLWAAYVVLLLGVGVLVVGIGAGFAKDEDTAGAKKCSEATLEGTYLFAFDGVEIKGNDDQAPFA